MREVLRKVGFGLECARRELKSRLSQRDLLFLIAFCRMLYLGIVSAHVHAARPIATATCVEHVCHVEGGDNCRLAFPDPSSAKSVDITHIDGVTLLRVTKKDTYD